MEIGWIGLGIMGSRMAANLQKGGHALTVYNRTRAHAETLLQNGATWAETPQAVASRVDVLMTMLSTPEVVEAMALGDQGFLKAMKPGSLWVDSSTVNPSFSRRMAEEAARVGVRFMDAPVAGTKMPAENAQLTYLVGGSSADLESIRPMLEKMSQKIIHAGSVGMGASLKMVYNLVLGQAMIAFAEALTLGEGLGLDRGLIFDSLGGSSMLIPVVLNKRKKIDAGDYSADFPLQWLQKDLQLMSVSGYEVGKALPVTNAAKEIYQLAVRSGLGEQDISAIYRFLAGDDPQKDPE
jgi:3-hydroxyisobutyrate dehydrogenase/glyoxylate/succinic semialdehyde reductase